MIAPVLAALGVYRDALCQWPPYASRVAFELWAPKQQQQQQQPTESPSHYVRVVYNGQDVTHMVPTCAEELNSGRHAGSNKSLCSLSALQRQIDSMIAPHASIETACAAFDVVK